MAHRKRRKETPMSDLVPYRTHPLALRDRRAVAEVRDARRPARRAAARVQAAALVAHVGLVNTEVLTNLEVQAVKRQGALIDERAKAIVDTYAGLVTTELARLGLGSE
jgi:hypothetical protein